MAAPAQVPREAPVPLQTNDPASLQAQMDYLLYRRRFGEIVTALTQVTTAPDFVVDGWTGAYFPRLGWAQRWSGDEAAARATFADGQRKLTALRTTWDDNGYLSSNLALIAAGLGDAAAVEREGGHSLELIGGDKYIGSNLLYGFAAAQALVGRKEQALATLEQAQLSPRLQYGDLRYSPQWDSVREEPRFKQLLANSQAAQARAKP
jgi:hypothetical protein